MIEKETVGDEPFCMRGSNEAFVETRQPGSKIKSREGTYKFKDVPLRRPQYPFVFLPAEVFGCQLKVIELTV